MANIKLGCDILTGVDKVKLQDADVSDTYDTFVLPQGTKSIVENGTYDVSNFASAAVNVPSSGATMTEAASVTSQTLTFNGTSGYTNFAILFVANTGYAAASQVYGIYTYTKYDNYYRAVYYMSYGGAKFNFTKNSSPDEVKRSGDNFTISSTYISIGLGWITNTSQGKYIGFFW